MSQSLTSSSRGGDGGGGRGRVSFSLNNSILGLHVRIIADFAWVIGWCDGAG